MAEYETTSNLRMIVDPELAYPGIEFSSSDNVFERSRKMLRFAGLVNADQSGMSVRMAEAVQIYMDLDSQRLSLSKD